MGGRMVKRMELLPQEELRSGKKIDPEKLVETELQTHAVNPIPPPQQVG